MTKLLTMTLFLLFSFCSVCVANDAPVAAAKTGDATAVQPVKTSETTASKTTAPKKVAPKKEGDALKTFPFTHSLRPTRGKGKNKKADPLTLEFSLSPKNAKPGDVVTLSVKLSLDDEWHAYGLKHPVGGSGLPIKITMSTNNGLEPIDTTWKPNRQPHKTTDVNGKTLLQHSGEVIWTRQFKVKENVTSGKYGVRGGFFYQVCDASKCLSPKTVPFELGYLPPKKDKDSEDENPLSEEEAKAMEGAAAKFGVALGDGSEDEGSVLVYLLLAFLGGMILNVMPCVLPVIAIKVMSFVQQAGESRKRIFALNACYSCGVISVFLVLAIFAVTAGMTFGGLFQKPEFNLVMVSIIFIMALSLVGVFEIPIPGIIGSSAGGQHQEGLHGAFITGIFATLLATPCTGPFVGTTLAWSVKQEPVVTFLLWGSMGVGMAFPYLVLGLFPGLIRLLPKPGNWMVRFKEFAGFALFGTVIFFIASAKSYQVVPLLTVLLGLGIGFWMIGNLYNINSSLKEKNTVRITAFLAIAGMCGLGYILYEEPGDKTLFTNDTLAAALENNQTVVIDFTADWCVNCKINEKMALNTEEVRSFAEKNNVSIQIGDYTDESKHIKYWLTKFKTQGVPLTVVIPGNRPDQTIALGGVYSKETLLEAMKKAITMRKKTGTKPKKKTDTEPKKKKKTNSSSDNSQDRSLETTSLKSPKKNSLPWTSFTKDSVEKSLKNKQAVLLFFTADWCVNCKMNEEMALETKDVVQFIKKHNISTQKAYYTKASPLIKHWLKKLKTDGIPLTAIFSAKRPDKPVMLHGIYSQKALLKALLEALD